MKKIEKKKSEPEFESKWVRSLVEKNAEMIRKQVKESGRFMPLLLATVKEYVDNAPDVSTKILREAEVHASCHAYSTMVFAGLSETDAHVRHLASQAVLMDLLEHMGKGPQTSDDNGGEQCH